MFCADFQASIKKKKDDSTPARLQRLISAMKDEKVSWSMEVQRQKQAAQALPEPIDQQNLEPMESQFNFAEKDE